MSHELRAMVCMLDALRHELRAASFVANRGQYHEILQEWKQSDDLTYEAIKAVQHGEQETEAGIRKNWVDTDFPT